MSLQNRANKPLTQSPSQGFEPLGDSCGFDWVGLFGFVDECLVGLCAGRLIFSRGGGSVVDLGRFVVCFVTRLSSSSSSSSLELVVAGYGFGVDPLSKL